MPEEINRILTDRISDFLFCPTETAVINLINEGFDNFDNQVHLTGDVMYDAALHYEKRSDQESTILEQLNLNKNEFILCTIHRQENTDTPERLSAIIDALNEINKSTSVVLPLHPRTKKIIRDYGLKLEFDPIEPVGYIDILQLIKHSSLVMTDSGGMQKEAFFFKKFCITLRNETEWVELIENKLNILAGANKEKILQVFYSLQGKSFPQTNTFYGSGKASEEIMRVLVNANKSST
jgi:UDP-GlcNAc3NAcA epimerase